MKSNGVSYRAASPQDFLSIAALDRVAWQGNNNPEFIPDGEHAWRIWAEHALTFVAEQDGKLLGAVLAFPCLNGCYCLHKVMVFHEHRKAGIGSGLFQTLFAELDTKAADVFLTVDPENVAAVNLYENWGFTEREFVAGYYRPSEDRLVLTRKAGRIQRAETDSLER